MPQDAAPSDVAPPAPPAGQPEATLPLDEFCTLLSGADRRIELIAAFAHIERAAGRVHDTRAAYAQRFAAVGSRPTTR